MPSTLPPSAASPVFSLDLHPESGSQERVFFQWSAGVLRAVRAHPRASSAAQPASAPFESAAWSLLETAQNTANAIEPPVAGAAARRWSQRLSAVCAGDAGPSALARAFGEGLLIWREVLPTDPAETDEVALLASAREAPDGGVAWGLPQTVAAASRDVGRELAFEAVDWARSGGPSGKA